MPKAQKVAAVEDLKVELRESEAALLTSFRGLKVAEMTELRRSLAASQTEFKVVKNTLAKIAAKGKYVKSITLAPSMGPGVRVDVTRLKETARDGAASAAAGTTA